MTDAPDSVEDSFELIEEMAEDQDVEVAPEFVREIQNYLAKDRVRDLSEAQKAVIALRIGERAVAERASLPGGNVAIRDDVNNVILRLCGDPFGACHGAAFRILSELDDPGDLSPLTASD